MELSQVVSPEITRTLTMLIHDFAPGTAEVNRLNGRVLFERPVDMTFASLVGRTKMMLGRDDVGENSAAEAALVGNNKLIDDVPH